MQFTETQKFRQTWLLFILIAVNVAVVATVIHGFTHQIIRGTPVGTHPLPDWALIALIGVAMASSFGVSYLMWVMKLVTEVDETGVRIQFYPLLKRHIKFSEITKCQAKTYNPLLEYGGWGIRFGFTSNAYNVSGNRGVYLEFQDGKPLLIGSRQSLRLAEVIQSHLNEATRPVAKQKYRQR